MQIVYCNTCGFRISPQDVESGSAIIAEENIAYCAKCAPSAPAPVAAVKPKPGSRTNIVPAGSDTVEMRAPSARMRPATRITRRTPSGTAVSKSDSSRSIPPAVPAEGALPPDPAKPKQPMGVLIAGVIVGVVALAAGIFLLLHGGKPKSAEQLWAMSPNDAAISKAPPAKPIAQTAPEPETKRAIPGLSLLGGADPDASQKKDPVAAQPVDATTFSKKAANGEIFWIDGAMPAGAIPDGSAKADSWKWVENPALSGRSHIANLPTEHKASQHSFSNANPPLKCGAGDKLYAYAFINADIPPKEIMMQFSYQKSWEHRVYWGVEDELKYPGVAPLCKGALPDKGRWVRLEVSGAEIGIAASESIDGWSFDDFGGIVYWNRAGFTPGPPPPTPPPAAPATVANAAAPLADGTSLAKVMWNQMQGGKDIPNLIWGKESRAIWGKKSAMPFLSGTFNVASHGPAYLAIWSRTDPVTCRVSIKLNNQEIFSGAVPAENQQWVEQHIAIPDGFLKAGANDFRIDNLEDSDKITTAPWYMLHSLEVLSGPAPAPPPAVVLPPLVASLVKLSLKEITGGTPHLNWQNKGKEGRAIHIKKLGNYIATAPFDIRFGAGPAALIIDNIPQGRQPTVLISIDINGKEIFKGNAPATPIGAWGEQRFEIPDGVLKLGRNDLKIENLDTDNNDIWYMISTLEISATRALPPEDVLAAGAPKKTLEDDGMLFNIDIAGKYRAKLKGKGAQKTVLFAGPGLNMKDFDLKVFGKQWGIKTPSKELGGPANSPAQLLYSLPAELETLKPEVVVLVGDAGATRKLTEIERQDWEDAARLCARMGAVPVLCIPAASGKEENTDLRNLLVRAANDNQIPAFQFKTPELFPVQLKQLMGLIEKHVFLRDTSAGPDGKSSKEIE